MATCKHYECIRLTKWHHYIFFVYLKFGACYITGQWGDFRVKNATIRLHIHFCYFFFVVFHHKICVFIIFISFFWYSLKFPQQNINQSEMWIGGFQLSVELYAWSFSFAVFDPKSNSNFEGDTLYKAPISVTPSDCRIRKISDSRIFFSVSSEHTMWPSNDLSLIWIAWCSSRDLCQTTPVCELFKPAKFGSRFFPGARSQIFLWRKNKVAYTIMWWLLIGGI